MLHYSRLPRRGRPGALLPPSGHHPHAHGPLHSDQPEKQEVSWKYFGSFFNPLLFQEIRKRVDVVQRKSPVKHHPQSVLEKWFIWNFRWQSELQSIILIWVTAWGYQALWYGHTKVLPNVVQFFRITTPVFVEMLLAKYLPINMGLWSLSFSKLMHMSMVLVTRLALNGNIVSTKYLYLYLYLYIY